MPAHPPRKEFVGKVKRSDASWDRRFCAHPKAGPYSYLAQRAGKTDLGMLARRLWSRVLAEERGAGRERGGPRRAGPKQGLRARGSRPGAVTRAPGGAGGPVPRGAAPHGSPARAQASQPPELETRHPPWGGALAAPHPRSRAPLRARGFPPPRRSDPGRGAGRWHSEARGRTPAGSGRGGGAARPGARRAPRGPRGASAAERSPGPWLPRARDASSRLPLCPRRAPASPGPRLRGEGERQRQTWGDPVRPQPKVRGEKRLSQPGRLTEAAKREAQRGAAWSRSAGRPGVADARLLPGGNRAAALSPGTGFDPSVPPRGERGGTRRDLSHVVFRKLPPVSLPVSLLSVYFPAWTQQANK